jgi:hypothetical protein
LATCAAALDDADAAVAADAPPALGDDLGVPPAAVAVLLLPLPAAGGDMDENAKAGIDGAGTGVSWINGTEGGATGVFCCCVGCCVGGTGGGTGVCCTVGGLMLV